MIYEFAVEPALAATWHDPAAARFFVAQMGVGTPRLLCQFPRLSWPMLTMAALQRLVPDPALYQMAQKRLEVLLRSGLFMPGTARDAVLGNDKWLDAARREHGKRGFRAVLVDQAPYVAKWLLEGTTFDPLVPPWAPDAHPVLRDGAAFPSAIEPLLRCCTEVRLVDPYFDPGVPEYMKPLRHMLAAFQRDAGAVPLSGEIHTTTKKSDITRPGPMPLEHQLATEKANDARTYLTPLVGPRLTLELFVWAEIAGGEKLHNRYVLTKHGGLAVQAGLDSAKLAAPGHTGKHSDDVTLLSRSQFVARWRDYAPGSTAFRPVIPPTKIPP